MQPGKDRTGDGGGNSRLLTKDEIFQADDLKYQEIEVPEWGGKVRVAVMTGRQRQEFQARYTDTKKVDVAFMERLIASCCVNRNGNLLFTDKDVEALGKKSFAALNRVFEAAVDLNGMSVKGVENLKND